MLSEPELVTVNIVVSILDPSSKAPIVYCPGNSFGIVDWAENPPLLSVHYRWEGIGNTVEKKILT